MHSKIQRLLAATVLAFSALAIPMTAAHAGPTEADAKGGDVGIERIIPGRCEYTSAEPTLSRGSSGVAVRQAQCEYNWATTGTNLVVDGSFGPATEAAIKRFQACVGIQVDGEVGPVTWSHLNYWAASNYYPPGC